MYHDSSCQFKAEQIMGVAPREKFSSQANPEVLSAMRELAELQGRQFQALLDEAMREYLDKQQTKRPRKHVLEAFATSLEEFDHLYRELAK